MTEANDLAREVAQLQAAVSEMRQRRVAAQKTASTKQVLETALERAARDRSSGATAETDQLRDEIGQLRNDIVEAIHDMDRIRDNFAHTDQIYGGIPGRARLIQEFNREAEWRNRVLDDERTLQARLNFPSNEALN